MKTITIQAHPSWTIGGIKGVIEREEGIAPARQRLIYAGKELDDARKLGDYGVQREGTLHLVVRPR